MTHSGSLDIHSDYTVRKERSSMTDALYWNNLSVEERFDIIEKADPQNGMAIHFAHLPFINQTVSVRLFVRAQRHFTPKVSLADLAETVSLEDRILIAFFEPQRCGGCATMTTQFVCRNGSTFCTACDYERNRK